MKNGGLFLNMAKWCFLGVCVFWGFNIEKVCLWCVWHCFKSVKNDCFSQSFGLFSGVAYCSSSGFGRFRCFCVSCVCFSFLYGFCFCFVCFVRGPKVATSLGPKPAFFCCFFVCVSFCLCLSVIVFFLGGFKGHVRSPKGPPHLALNPP